MLENIFFSLLWLFLILLVLAGCVGLVAVIILGIAMLVKEWKEKDGKGEDYV